LDSKLKEKREEGKILGGTTVKYNIIFHNPTEDQKPSVENTAKKLQKNESNLQSEISLNTKS